ncbi:hypothetical protein H8B06_05645 [Sphingobacterium sp. DN00404]|uniref:Uncharacterized protein n=1 Tax=Sphingobacterium micropteri TaxID=2763501 RepID=A0ABR7YLT7_9SPHI|nr:hypothetical protein [Sphingobacterium micropteri]MBD1432300.1 hypothetical protein [Sphingobacterium micropteri]
MKEAKLSEPQFKTDGMFTVILPRVVEKSSGKSSWKLLPENCSDKRTANPEGIRKNWKEFPKDIGNGIQ